MEVVYLVLMCAVGIAHASKGVSYYYPPVYGKMDEADYTPVKSDLKQRKGVSYFYPPVYGEHRREDEEVEEVYTPTYSPRSDQQEPEDSEEAMYYDEKLLYDERGRTHYRRRSHDIPKSAETYRVMEERPYVEEEKEEEREVLEDVAYYKQPEEKSYPKKKKTRKCLQCEYSPPKEIKFEVLVREPRRIKVPKEIEECEWEKNIEYVYVAPRKGSRHMYGRYKEVPKYEKTCYPKTIYETKTVYRNRYVKKRKMGQPGGFEACKGPLTAYTAKKYGVDDWDCHNNCYVKQDKSGTITRGCYSGQYKIDPNRLGCHYQGDTKQDLYCFCTGDHCNGKSVPTRRSYDK